MLTREKVLAMEAGIEIDKLIAIHVMGWETRKYYTSDDGYHEHYIRDEKKYENVNYPDHWQPSKYIDAAWEVFEKLVQNHSDVTLTYPWSVRADHDPMAEETWKIYAEADTAPLAICRAALLTTLTE